jgi:hypothetical protein
MPKNDDVFTKADAEFCMKFPHAFGKFLGYNDLSQIHSDWILNCWLGRGQRALQAHRNSFKTTSILIVGAVWWLTFFNPDERILFLRKSWEQSADVVKAVKLQFESESMRWINASYFHVNDIRGGTWRDSALSISTKKIVTPENNIDCLGIGGNITGGHYTKIFADDIITIKDRVSRAERENTKVFIRELTNISTVDGATCYTGTTWHRDDGWQLLPAPKKFAVGSIEIKGFDSAKILELKQQLGASLFSANYELKHVADSEQLFSEPRYGKWPYNATVINAWVDPSYQGKDSTALAMIAMHENEIYCRGWVWPENVIERYDDIVSNLKYQRAGTCYVDVTADKGYSSRDLGNKFPAVVGRMEHQNKHIKILTFLKQNWSKLIFADDCQPEFINQIMDYNEFADLVDAPDALACLIREMDIGVNTTLTGDLTRAVGRKSAVISSRDRELSRV